MSSQLLWVCAGWTFTLIGFSHHLVERFNIWREKMGLVGRYTVGVLSFTIPFGVWVAMEANLTAIDALVGLVVLQVTAGASTLLMYTVDKARHDDFSTHAAQAAQPQPLER